MSKQTAVEWLWEEFRSIQPITVYADMQLYEFFFKKAKRMEKEQIKEAFHGISAEQYYNETYGGDHE